MDLNYLKELEKMLSNAAISTQENINKAMKMQGISESDKEKLKEANKLLNQSRQDLENYKQKLKDDFNI
jgi:hypothetical protein